MNTCAAYKNAAVKKFTVQPLYKKNTNNIDTGMSKFAFP